MMRPAVKVLGGEALRLLVDFSTLVSGVWLARRHTLDVFRATYQMLAVMMARECLLAVSNNRYAVRQQLPRIRLQFSTAYCGALSLIRLSEHPLMKKLTYSVKIEKPRNVVFEKIADKSVYPEVLLRTRGRNDAMKAPRKMNRLSFFGQGARFIFRTRPQ